MPELAPVTHAVRGTTRSSKLILLLGDTGGGKTSLALTAPGKKFGYFFDPNAISTVEHFCEQPDFDLDYLQFLPDKLPMNVSTLKKNVGDPVRGSNFSNDLYLKWEKDFEDRIDAGFFEPYDTIIFDSITTFADMVMDRILFLNQRPGQWPQQDDWGPQMNSIAAVMRTLTSLGKTIVVTGHYELKQDEVSKRIFFQPLVTGRLKTKLPLLFSEIWKCEGDTDTAGKSKWTIQVKPDRLTPLIRCTLRGLEKEVKHDVTLDFNKPLANQGLSKLLASK